MLFQPCFPCHPWILMVPNVICGLSFSFVIVPWVTSGFIRILWFSSPSHVQNQCFQILTLLGTMENKEPLCGCTTVKIIIIVIILIHTWPKEGALLDAEMSQSIIKAASHHLPPPLLKKWIKSAIWVTGKRSSRREVIYFLFIEQEKHKMKYDGFIIPLKQSFSLSSCCFCVD